MRSLTCMRRVCVLTLALPPHFTKRRLFRGTCLNDWRGAFRVWRCVWGLAHPCEFAWRSSTSISFPSVWFSTILPLYALRWRDSTAPPSRQYVTQLSLFLSVCETVELKRSYTSLTSVFPRLHRNVCRPVWNDSILLWLQLTTVSASCRHSARVSLTCTEAPGSSPPSTIHTRR